MKIRNYFIILLFVCLCKFSTSQVLCIYCYDQNDTISAGVNNLLLNGGFENGSCTPFPPLVTFCPNATGYPHCNITNWTATGGGALSYAHCIGNFSSSSIIVEGTKAAYFGNEFCLACSQVVNDTSCLYNIDCTVGNVPVGYPESDPLCGWTTGFSLKQTVTGLAPGNIYVLEFWAGGEAHAGGSFHFTKEGLFAIDIGFGDTLLRNKPTDPLTGTAIGTRYIVEFNATSSSHTIRFTNWGHICDSCTELVIDDVRLYTLAELSLSVPHCTVGIDALALFSPTNVFPNPFTSKLNVKTNSNELSEIILYDIASRELFHKKFTNSVSLNTEQLEKGIYLYEVRNRSGLRKKGKVVKD